MLFDDSPNPNWCDVEIVTVAPPKNDKRNCILIDPKKGIKTYWGHFKNAHSFAGELPLCIPVASAPFEALIRKWVPHLKGGKWLLPRREGGEPYDAPAFGGKLAEITLGIVNKRFTCQRMRISFIQYYHQQHEKPTVKQLEALMRTLHQRDIGVHLSYDKLKTAVDKEEAEEEAAEDE